MRPLVNKISESTRPTDVPCRRDPKLWDADVDCSGETASERTARHNVAIALCNQCAMFSDCEQYVADDPAPSGVWAGVVFGAVDATTDSTVAVTDRTEEGASAGVGGSRALSPNQAFDLLIATLRNQHERSRADTGESLAWP